MERYRPYLHVLAGLPLGWLPRGALLYFSLTQKAATASIKVLDHTGKVVREMPAKTEPGLHRAAWGSRGADDHVSFCQLLERHRQRLRRMIAVRLDRRVAGRADASDVLQEAGRPAA
jgi:hypothetical protein